MVAIVGDVEFRDCPARYVDPADESLVDYALGGILRDLPVIQLSHLPNRLIEAAEFVASLRE